MEKELKKKLKDYSDIFREAQEKGKKEADVVMYLVQFFKDALGYDVFKEISKEYQIKGKYCDVAIKIKGQVEMLIEAKQPGVKLADRHIEQAEIYAMKSGTKWVLLTNGCDWRLFHLSFDEEGGIESALVFKTDLLKSFQEKPDDVVDKFKLLHKKNFTKGELEKFWKKKIMLIPLSLSKALFTEDVLKAISREVNRGAEVRVGIEDIARALKNMFDKEVLADMADLKIKKKRRKKIKATARKKARKTMIKKGQKADYTGKTPVKVKLFNKSFEVRTWRDALVSTAEALIKRRRSAFNKLTDSEIMKGKSSFLLTKERSALRAPHQLSNGIFLETNLSANSIVRIIKNRLLKGCGYKETDIKIHLKD
jgi:hypothetical protein